MARDTFDWALVRCFLAVLDAGSLMGAARALGCAASRRSAGTWPNWRRSWACRCSSAPAAASRRPRPRAASPTRRGRWKAARPRWRSGWPGSATPPPAPCASPPARRWPATCCRRCWPQLRQAEPGIQVELVASPTQLSNLLRREADIAVRMVQPGAGTLVARKLADITVGAWPPTAATCARRGTPRQPRTCSATPDRRRPRRPPSQRGFARLGLALARSVFALRTDDLVAYGRLCAPAPASASSRDNMRALTRRGSGCCRC